MRPRFHLPKMGVFTEENPQVTRPKRLECHFFSFVENALFWLAEVQTQKRGEKVVFRLTMRAIRLRVACIFSFLGSTQAIPGPHRHCDVTLRERSHGPGELRLLHTSKRLETFASFAIKTGQSKISASLARNRQNMSKPVSV